MEGALENAKQAKVRLEREIADAQRLIELKEYELRTVDQFLAMYAKFEADEFAVTIEPGNLKKVAGFMGGGTAKRRRNSSKEEVAQTAREILIAAAAPMSRGDLFKAVLDRGLIVEGAEPAMVFSTMLWRQQDKVVRLKSGGYWITGEPLPPRTPPWSDDELPLQPGTTNAQVDAEKYI